MSKRTNRVVREATPDERRDHAEIRSLAAQEFPPLDPPRESSAKNQIAAVIRKARKNQGLTWDALAKKAGISEPNIVRDIEYGHDAALSKVELVAEALGLKLQLVDVSS